MILVVLETSGGRAARLYEDPAEFGTTLAIIAPVKIWDCLELYEPLDADELREMALDYSGGEWAGLSWGELADIQRFFAKYGERFGMLDELEENGIC